MKTKVLARFPNESEYVEIFLNASEFIPEKKFHNYYDKEVFGWYDKTFIAIKFEDYKENFLTYIRNSR